MQTSVEFCHLRVFFFVTEKIILFHRLIIKTTWTELILKIPE